MVNFPAAVRSALVNVREGQLLLLFGPQVYACVTMLGVIGLLFYALQGVIAPPTLNTWTATAAGLTILRFFFALYFKVKYAAGQSIWFWLGGFLILFVPQVSVFAAAGILLFPGDAPVHQIVTILMMVGVAAGGALSLAAYLPAAVFFILVMVAPIAYRTSLEPGYPVVFPFLFILYVSFLLAAVRQHNRFIIRTFDLQQRNEINLEQIETAQKQLHLITDSIPALVTYIDKDLRYSYVNKGVEKSFGRPGDYFIGKSVAEIVGPESYEQMHPFFVKALTGEAGSFEIVRQFPTTGQVIGQLDVVPDFDERGEVRGIFSLLTDITQSRQGEHSLRESESRFSAAFDASPSMMAIVRMSDNVMLNVNRQWCEVMGYSPSEVVNKTINELDIWVSAEERNRITEQLAKATDLRHAEIRLRTYFGSIIIVDLNIERIEFQNEPHLLILSNDVTERHHWEEELLQAKEGAEKASRAKSGFLANMSHELRTPLNAVIGFSEFLGREFAGPLNETQHSYVRDIRKSGDHLLDLINDVLDLSKIEAGKEEVKNERLQVPLLIEDVVALVRDQAGDGEINLSTNIGLGCPDIFADLRLMKQILINLLSNAVKFTPRGGKVEISVKVVAGVEPSGAAKWGGLQFTVTDNGLGIKPEDVPKALSKFEQIENTFNREHQGTGLGLPLAVAMTDLHGGRLDLQSTFGVGTAVTVTLPRDRIVGPRS